MCEYEERVGADYYEHMIGSPPNVSDMNPGQRSTFGFVRRRSMKLFQAHHTENDEAIKGARNNGFMRSDSVSSKGACRSSFTRTNTQFSRCTPCHSTVRLGSHSSRGWCRPGFTESDSQLSRGTSRSALMGAVSDSESSSGCSGVVMSDSQTSRDTCRSAIVRPACESVKITCWSGAKRLGSQNSSMISCHLAHSISSENIDNLWETLFSVQEYRESIIQSRLWGTVERADTQSIWNCSVELHFHETSNIQVPQRTCQFSQRTPLDDLCHSLEMFFVYIMLLFCKPVMVQHVTAAMIGLGGVNMVKPI